MGAICVRIVNDGNIYFDSNKADNESSLAIFLKPIGRNVLFSGFCRVCEIFKTEYNLE